MAIQTQYVVYNAKNFTTGLTDVTASVFKDGSNVASATGLALAEINATDIPGRYRLALSPAQIVTFGGAGTYIIQINSASKSARATAKLIVEVNSNDDLEAHLVVVEGKIDVLSSDIAAMQLDMTSVKGTVENTNSEVLNGTTGLAAIKGLIDTALSGINSIQQSTRTVASFPSQLVTPSVGTELYKVLINIYNTSGGLEDPDVNLVNVSLQNASGLDRGNLFTGGGASPKAATRLSTGKYEIELTIPAGTSKEQINMLIDYTENGTALQAVRSANIVSSVDASGLAQQLTVDAILADTAVIQPQVADIQTLVNDATFGLAALKTAMNAIQVVADSSNSVLLSPTIGNQAIIDAITLTASQVSVNNIAADIVTVKGVGFAPGVDDLKSISDRQFTGGSAV